MHPVIDVSYLLLTKLLNTTFVMEVGAFGSIFGLFRGLLPFFVFFFDLLLGGIVEADFFFELSSDLLMLLAL